MPVAHVQHRPKRTEQLQFEMDLRWIPPVFELQMKVIFGIINLYEPQHSNSLKCTKKRESRIKECARECDPEHTPFCVNVRRNFRGAQKTEKSKKQETAAENDGCDQTREVCTYDSIDYGPGRSGRISDRQLSVPGGPGFTWKKRSACERSGVDPGCPAVFRCLLKLAGVTITVKGEENIPKDTAVLYVGNHRSYFDILTGYTTVPTLLGFVAKKEMEKIPILRTWMANVNCLFLDRKNIKEGLKTILQGIAEGEKWYLHLDLPGRNEKYERRYHRASSV